MYTGRFCPSLIIRLEWRYIGDKSLPTGDIVPLIVGHGFGAYG